MIISIEGIDGSGKTTLCKALSKKLKIPVLDLNTQMVEPRVSKCGSGKPYFNRDSWRVAAVALETLHLAGADAILDRTTLSCWAYQQRRDPDLTYLEQVIEHVKPYIVLVDTPIDSCRVRDPEAAERWSREELIWQKHRMLASAECFRERGVPFTTVSGHVDPGNNVYIIREWLKSEGEK